MRMDARPVLEQNSFLPVSHSGGEDLGSRVIDCGQWQRYISFAGCEVFYFWEDSSENSHNGLNLWRCFVDIPTRGSVAKWLRQRIANPSSSVRLRPEPLRKALIFQGFFFSLSGDSVFAVVPFVVRAAESAAHNLAANEVASCMA